MAVKTFQAKITTPHKRLLDYLWATHRIFNESLPLVIKLMLLMNKGKKGHLSEMFGDDTAEKLRAVYCDMMGLGYQSSEIDIILEEIPKSRRKNRSQNAHAWMEALIKKWGGESSGTINPKIIKLLQNLQQNDFRLFLRDDVFSYGGEDLGFVRRALDTAARRILNHEQNSETHKNMANEFQKEFDKWKLGESTRFAEFEKIRREFEEYEMSRTKEAEMVSSKPKAKVQIMGRMCRGWNDIMEELIEQKAGCEPEKAKNIIKGYQQDNPKDIGDINFFLWLSDKPHLWPFVRTTQKWNFFKLKERQYNAPIAFTYPKPNSSPEWFEFSVSSPGKMYNLLSLNPGFIELAVFVPNEDEALLKVFGLTEKLRKKDKQITPDISAVDFLSKSVDFDSYILLSESLHPAIRSFFKSNLPLDLKRFTHLRVKFPFSVDSRLNSRIKNFKPGTTGFKFGKGRASNCSAVCEYDRSMRSNKEVLRNEGVEDWVTVGFQAARLRFLNGSPYLDFTVELTGDRESELKIKFPKRKKQGDVEIADDEPQIEKKVIPAGYTVVSIDLGQRFTGCLTALRYDGSELSVKPLNTFFLRIHGIELVDIEQHENAKRKLQEKTKVATRGEIFATRLKNHIDKMKRDRSKKAANQIVKFALKNKAHCVAFENLKGYRPDQEYGHRINTRLMRWNRREVVEWVKKIAQPYGVYVYDMVWPTYTSQRCSKCGSIGARFSLITKNQGKRDKPIEECGLRRRGKPLGLKTGYYQVIRGGKLFCCSDPECKIILNADFNASMNLGKRFFGEQKGLEQWSLNGLYQFYKSEKKNNVRYWHYGGKVLSGKDFFREISLVVQKNLNDKFNQGNIFPAGHKFRPEDFQDVPLTERMPY